MRIGRTWKTRKTKKMMKMRALNEDWTHMEGQTKKMMKIRALNEEKTHMEDPEDKEDDEYESLELGQDAHGRPGRQSK
jgi:hypothetical protein